ncbi:MAG: LLM class flavin-dependent oxidoreductase [Rhodobacteraceae bacterium]|jgi:luciferase family oxidoreductase group 1|nr:LLM class flavin-dependent oxidoreductase [Paracoccaceae bacterium]
MKYSVLDLCPVPEGSTTAEAIANTVDLARHAEAWGYHRHWMAEHHNMPGVASSATSVLIGHVAASTKSIRVGAGGIMLPNHSPLAIAEQFGTLATIHGNRIDLGLGRAPGGDMAVARALRRGMDPGDRFPDDVAELLSYLGPPDATAPVRAIPGEGTEVPVWILGSSLYGAQLAAYFGLPYAFASHFAPAALDQAVEVYRRNFQPSQWLDRPRFMLAVGVFAADTDAEGIRLRTSMQLAFARLRTGRPGKLPAPVDDIEKELGLGTLTAVNEALRVSATGSPAAVRRQLADLIDRYRPEEVILTGQIHDHAARLRSFAIAAEAMADIARKAAA